MRPNFEYYMVSLDNWPFEVGVDLSLLDQLPIEGLEHRLHVRLNLNHPSDDGLSTKKEDALLAAIEEELIHSLDTKDYRLAAAVTHRQARTLVFYSRIPKNEDDAIHRVLKAAQTHVSEVIEERDPEWTEYKSQLYPNEEMLHQIQDRKVLKEFDRHGDDPSALHTIEPCFGNLSAEALKTVAAQLETAGFEVTEVNPPSAAKSKDGTLKARVESPLGLAIIDDFRHTWLAIASAVGGTYLGWSAEVVPVSGKNNDMGLRGHLDEVHDPIADYEPETDESDLQSEPKKDDSGEEKSD